MLVKYEKKAKDMNIFILRVKYPQLELSNRIFNLTLTNTTINNTIVQLSIIRRTYRMRFCLLCHHRLSPIRS